jgi:hypothetical protein
MSGKTTITSAVLIEQKSDAERRLVEVRQQQVDAIESGSDFEHSSEILLLNERIAALDTAISRAEQREAVEEEKAELVRSRARAAEIQTIAETNETDRAAALAEAEAHAKGYVDAIRRFADLTEKQRLHLLESISFYSEQPEHLQRRGDVYSHKPGQMHLDHMLEFGTQAVSFRIGNYLGAALESTGWRQIGNVSWRVDSTDAASLTDSWAERELNAVRGKLAADLVLNMDFIVSNIGAGAEDAAE